MIQFVLQTRILAMAALNPPLLFSQLYSYDWYRQTLLDWVHDLGIPAKSKILELGCGPGNLSAEMAEMGFDVVGADKSERMIGHALGLNSHAKFIEADAYNLPFEQGSFDAIILASLFNLVPNRLSLLNEIQRVLKPGGIISVQFPLPAFNADVAKQISARRKFPPNSSAAITVWASVGKKLRVEEICDEFLGAGFADISTRTYLENNIASVTAYKANN